MSEIAWRLLLILFVVGALVALPFLVASNGANTVAGSIFVLCCGGSAFALVMRAGAD